MILVENILDKDKHGSAKRKFSFSIEYEVGSKVPIALRGPVCTILSMTTLRQCVPITACV